MLLNLLAMLGVAVWLLEMWNFVPVYAACLAALPAAAFTCALLWSRAGASEARREFAAALNGACMLMLSGVAAMYLTGVLHPLRLLPLFGIGAVLAAWNLVSLTDGPSANLPDASVAVPAVGQLRGRLAPARRPSLPAQAQELQSRDRGRWLESLRQFFRVD